MRLLFRPTVLAAALRGAMPVGIAGGGAAVAGIVGMVTMPDAESGLRMAGTLLQALGLATVALGIAKVRQLFGRPSATQSFMAWLRLLGSAFFAPKPTVVNLEGAVSLSSAGSARLTVGVPEGAPLHKRITALEKNLASFRSEYDKKVEDLDRSIGAARSAADKAVADTREEVATVDAKMAELAVGGVHVELIGLAWLLLGVVATGLASEIGSAL